MLRTEKDSTKRDKGFETFVMTGDKIIRTNPITHHDNQAVFSPPKQMIVNGIHHSPTYNGTQKDEVPSPTKSPMKKNIRTPSRIPKPSCTKPVPLSSPVCSPKCSIPVSINHHNNFSTEPKNPLESRNPNNPVNNNVITEAWIKAEATRQKVENIYDPNTPPPKPPLPSQSSPMLSKNIAHELSSSQSHRPISGDIHDQTLGDEPNMGLGTQSNTETNNESKTEAGTEQRADGHAHVAGERNNVLSN